MNAVIFATAREAAPFIALADQQPLREEVPAIFGRRDGRNGWVTLISGMGPSAARLAARTAIEDWGVGRLINAGICGTLRSGPAWRPGKVFAVATVCTVDNPPSPPSGPITCDPHTWVHLPPADLVTRSSPLFDAGLRKQLARWGDLVDMEGAAIAEMARDNGLPCTLIKGITDLATEGGRADLHRRLTGVSRRIAEILAGGLMDNRAIAGADAKPNEAHHADE